MVQGVSVEERRVAVLRRAYERFDARDVDALLAMMAADVEWPDVAGGAVLHGHDEVRAYWEGQFAVADPRVVPVEVVAVGDDVVAVVEQRVSDLAGVPLGPMSVVFHRYTFDGDLVRRMVVHTDREQALART